MPTLYPHPLPESVLADWRRAAEVGVYRALEEALSSGYEVFYSVAWLSKGERGGLWDGEADFVIAHPEWGVLVVEVKGGEIIFDAPTGKWASRDARGEVHDIKDPFVQAVRGKKALLGKLLEMPTLKGRWITAGHAVCFPAAEKGKGALAAHATPEIILDHRDMGALRQRIEEIFGLMRMEGRHQPLGGNGMAALRGLLARSFELRMPLGKAAAAEARQMLRLSEAQFATLDSLSRNRRMAITGGAGTGKTLLAVEKARRLAGEGFRTLLTCFNIPLEAHLRASVGEVPGLTVQRFHRLCYEAACDHTVEVAPLEPTNPDGRYWNEELPQALLEARQRGFPAFDAIVVDEAQDLTDAYWLALVECLADQARGILYVFLDEHQCLYSRETGFLADLPSFHLPENLRNTRAIHNAASPFGPAEGLASAGPEGRPIEVVALEGRAALEERLGEILFRLTGEGKVNPGDISILTGRRPERFGLASGMTLAGLPAVDAEHLGRGNVSLDTIHRFKGLEAPVVILTGLEGMRPDLANTLLYVGITRAKHHLVVLESAEVLEKWGLKATDS